MYKTQFEEFCPEQAENFAYRTSEDICSSLNNIKKGLRDVPSGRGIAEWKIPEKGLWYCIGPSMCEAELYVDPDSLRLGGISELMRVFPLSEVWLLEVWGRGEDTLCRRWAADDSILDEEGTFPC